MVQVMFACQEYTGELVKQNSETLSGAFFALNRLPENLFEDHRVFLEDLVDGSERPVVG
ncbi:hypothetical protein [Rossellomorea aquimaris]|uniref:hypothetical protein n=1 Tax=Rossellomorea aquimaris TaxID=189382 RepID=UPI001CFDF333|nr:hypothetical protein [Rossellomorea aquimaris]